jgi:hypothetical protein
MYDTDTNKWTADSDWEAYFPDGSVYDTSKGMNDYGWYLPEEGSQEEKDDAQLYRTLTYIVDTWPGLDLE